MTTRLLPGFTDYCRAWYVCGHTRRPSEARWRVYVELAQTYGPLATVRHVALLREALNRAEARAKREVRKADEPNYSHQTNSDMSRVWGENGAAQAAPEKFDAV